jgi:FkbM family methyltransferase
MYFDIGANIGNWSLSNINNCDKIIAIEASPLTYSKLIQNCNRFNKITPLNYAVCNNYGNDIIFYECSSDTLSTINKDWLTNSKSRFYNYKYREIIVKSITIDDLINKYGNPSLIKIDVEGGEYECIKSLTKKVDLLCFEWASEVNDITFNCLDYLYNLGFNYFYIQNGDNYIYIPTKNEFYDINNAKNKLSKTIPKVDWGMIWCM